MCRQYVFILLAISLLSCAKDKTSPEFFQKKLKGYWHGTGTYDYYVGAQWQADFHIEKNGHYWAKVVNVDHGYITTVFDNGVDSVDNPHKQFLIDSISPEGLGYGVAYFYHWDGVYLPVEIVDLSFSNKYKRISFGVHWNSNIRYTLDKVRGSDHIP